MVARGKAAREQLEAAGFVDVHEVEDRGATWLAARKPWPTGMDEWSHPRHSASGNAASQDSLVAPPRRVRWVAGAESEVPGMVSAGGRNFYAGVLARDGFNGLRLWHRDLTAPSEDGRFVMKSLGANSAAPVAGGGRLYVAEQKMLYALDAATGEVQREYPDAGAPEAVLFDQGTLISVTEDSVRALDAESAELKWSVPASDPRFVVAGDDSVVLLQGQPRRNEIVEAVTLDMASGRIRWKRGDLPWLGKVTRTVYHRGMAAFEVSTLNDEGPENALHILSAADGAVQLDHPFLPGANHRRQARAMFLEGRLWLLHGGKDADKNRLPVQVSAIDVLTGKTLVTHPAGLVHCFPPVMTRRYMISGEFDLTDLNTGQVQRASDHESRLRAGWRLGPRERPDLRDAQTLRLLAHASRVRRAGAGASGRRHCRSGHRAHGIPVGASRGSAKRDSSAESGTGLAHVPSRPVAQRRHSSRSSAEPRDAVVGRVSAAINPRGSSPRTGERTFSSKGPLPARLSPMAASSLPVRTCTRWSP